MLNFIIAAALNLALVFVVFFCLSFVTIGVASAVAGLLKRRTNRMRSTFLAAKQF
jgi:hypothetical protein